MTNRQIKRALRTLKQFCYSHERCGSCPFGEFRQDMGFTCYVQNIIDDERFLKAVSENVPDPNECKLCKWRAICDKEDCSGFERDLMATDPTVTISAGTIQYQPWKEFDDDL